MITKKSDVSEGPSASKLISERIAELADGRGKTLGIHEGEEVDASAFKALVRQAVALNSSGKSKPSKKAKS